MSGLCACLVLGGCALLKKKDLPPAAPPRAEISLACFSGTPLSGPGGKISVDPQTSSGYRIDIEWVALRAAPAVALRPLDSVARLAISPTNAATILPAGMLTNGVRFGDSTAAEAVHAMVELPEPIRSLPLATQTSALVNGVTAQFTATPVDFDDASVPTTKPATTPNQFRLQFFHAARATTAPSTSPAGLSIAVGVTNPADGSTETSVIDDISSDDARYVFYFPVDSNRPKFVALALLVRIHMLVSDEADRAALAALAAVLNSPTTIVSTGTNGPGAAWLTGAGAGLADAASRRSALLYLANVTNAPFAKSFVLTAADAQLAELADATKTALAENPLVPEHVRWAVERGALSAAATALAADANADVAALLSLHAGELGRHPDSLSDVLQLAGSVDDFEARVAAENLIFLEDNSPSSRVRAFDWLSARHRAPAGFDPLADTKARRAALDKAAEQQTATP